MRTEPVRSLAQGGGSSIRTEQEQPTRQEENQESLMFPEPKERMKKECVSKRWEWSVESYAAVK